MVSRVTTLLSIAVILLFGFFHCTPEEDSSAKSALSIKGAENLNNNDQFPTFVAFSRWSERQFLTHNTDQVATENQTLSSLESDFSTHNMRTLMRYNKEYARFFFNFIWQQKDRMHQLKKFLEEENVTEIEAILTKDVEELYTVIRLIIDENWMPTTTDGWWPLYLTKQRTDGGQVLIDEIYAEFITEATASKAREDLSYALYDERDSFVKAMLNKFTKTPEGLDELKELVNATDAELTKIEESTQENSLTWLKYVPSPQGILKHLDPFPEAYGGIITGTIIVGALAYGYRHEIKDYLQEHTDWFPESSETTDSDPEESWFQKQHRLRDEVQEKRRLKCEEDGGVYAAGVCAL